MYLCVRGVMYLCVRGVMYVCVRAVMYLCDRGVMYLRTDNTMAKRKRTNNLPSRGEHANQYINDAVL
jgi:hypothetical protein